MSEISISPPVTPESPKRAGRNIRLTPEQEQRTGTVQEPPAEIKANIEKAMATQQAAAEAEASKSTWQEPEFEKGKGKHQPCIDYEPPELNKCRDKVFRRKDQDTDKLYLVTGVYPSWDAAGQKLTSNEDYKWMIHLNVFYFERDASTGDLVRDKNNKAIRKLYTDGRTQPSGFDIPADSFKALFELDQDATDEVPHTFQIVH